ncbi:MAG: hypothetical protein VX755_10890 [Pseudomonadota bacterium]|nr:hypothetical protein [Pseudomonadota bacterium]
MLTNPAKEFELSVANFNPTIRITSSTAKPQAATGLRPVIELPAIQGPGSSYYENAFTDSSTSYTLALVIRSYGSGDQQVYAVDYSVTT